MGKRATRRHHLERMKAKAKRVHPDLPRAEHMANHLAKCSCWMCGNPRRKLKGKDRLTVAERVEALLVADAKAEDEAWDQATVADWRESEGL